MKAANSFKTTALHHLILSIGMICTTFVGQALALPADRREAYSHLV